MLDFFDALQFRLGVLTGAALALAVVALGAFLYAHRAALLSAFKRAEAPVAADVQLFRQALVNLENDAKQKWDALASGFKNLHGAADAAIKEVHGRIDGVITRVEAVEKMVGIAPPAPAAVLHPADPQAPASALNPAPAPVAPAVDTASKI